MRTLCGLLLLVAVAAAADFAAEFARFRDGASDETLYRFLWALPKGGDIHHHAGLSMRPEWLLDRAIADRPANGYEFYVRVRAANCPGDGAPPILWMNALKATVDALDDCRREEYKPLAALNATERARWISAMKLDQPGEGRNEFFEVIVPRLTALIRDPHVMLDGLVEMMRECQRHGVRYLETQFQPANFVEPNGARMAEDKALRLARERLARPDAIATGVTIRFQYVVIRFAPDAEQQFERAFRFVNANRDLWVGVNMAGREDNDKGHPLRFLDTLRRLRRTYPDVPLSLHAGEKDSPGRQVRDTLLLGATRVGHGLNLITDPDTMLLLRGMRALVEINLVSNRVLEYFPNLDEHPFPEYLRTGIAVCLNTDDQGVWDSNMTDEYFEAVRRFRLSWDEIRRIGRASLEHAFVDDETKARLLAGYDASLSDFERNWREKMNAATVTPSGYFRLRQERK